MEFRPFSRWNPSFGRLCCLRRFITMLVCLNVVLSIYNSPAAEITTQIGKKAPKWELLDLNGKTIKSEKYAGKVIVLNFWATWCPPCRAEIPDFLTLYKAYKDRNVVFVGVSMDAGLGPVKRFVRTDKVTYPVVMGNSKIISDYGNFSAIPQTFVIDTEGRIHSQFRGLVTKEDLKKALETLAEKPERK